MNDVKVSDLDIHFEGAGYGRRGGFGMCETWWAGDPDGIVGHSSEGAARVFEAGDIAFLPAEGVYGTLFVYRAGFGSGVAVHVVGCELLGQEGRVLRLSAAPRLACPCRGQLRHDALCEWASTCAADHPSISRSRRLGRALAVVGVK